jgi:large subunit ribosomal protein L25
VIHTVQTAVDLECMPQDLPKRIVTDIFRLADLGNSVRMRDVVLSDKVKILADLEEIIAIATAPKQEEISEVAPVAEALEEIERGKKE